MNNRVNYYTSLWAKGLVNSYGQLFFSNNQAFALLLALSTFVDPKIGVAGLISAIISLGLAVGMGYNHALIKDGTYSYNSLMTGLALGIFYEFNVNFVVVLIIASIFCFFLNLWILGKTSAKKLPLLSWSFIFVVWMIWFGGSNFSAFNLPLKSEIGLSTNFFPVIGEINTWLGDNMPSNYVGLYFKSLGAIMFQFNILAGILICIGLFYYSRIAWLLSIIGFFLGCLFYQEFEGDFQVILNIGFNFILTSIAIGGFFMVPSRKSILMVIVAVPVTALLISALHTLLVIPFGKSMPPMFSLPFCIMVTLILTGLGQRFNYKGLDFVTVQHFSPEKNHYKNFFHKERFKQFSYIPMYLPILGEWYISQGYAGGITHKGEWSQALDFDVRDEDAKTYRNPGTVVSDYYCYDLPVVAPAGGYIIEVLDNISDNKIGDANLENNWGNTLIIKHTEGLYSKLSHFKKGSFKVKVGDYIQKGDLLGTCGNSGRSPEPHLHFQVQATPYIGSKTIEYPMAFYLKKDEVGYSFESHKVPAEGETVQNIQSTKLLTQAFNLIPGKSLRFKIEGTKNVEEWDVHANAYNQTYLYCKESGSYAYFVNNGTIFYFTDFDGDKNSLLFKFYLSAQKIVLGYYKDLIISEKVNSSEVLNKGVKILQDLAAPFFHFSSANYSSSFGEVDNNHYPEDLWINAQIKVKVGGANVKDFQSSIRLKDEKLYEFMFNDGKQEIIAKCV